MTVKMNTSFIFNKNYEKCSVCGKKNTKKTYDDVCSQKCLHYKLEYNSITIPNNFINKLFLHCPSELNRYKQLVAYAERHQYNPKILINKANNIWNKKHSKII